MRVRVLIRGLLLSAVIIAGISSAPAAIPQFSFMPALSGLASFGFPASMVEPQGFMSPMALSPASMVGITSSLLPDGASQAAFNGFMPAISSTFSAAPGVSGLSPFTSPMGYVSQMPMASPLDLSNYMTPSLAFQPTIGSTGISPAPLDNYTEASNGKTVTINKSDVIHVQLPARVDKGYIWNLSTSGGLNVTASRMYPPEQLGSDFSSGTIALQATQEWDIKAIEPGTQHVTAAYRSDGGDGTTIKTYELTVIVV